MATNAYVSQSVPASYNSSPPPDDGSQTANNLVSWSKHTGKIGDPLKTFVQNVNSAVLAAFAKTINTDANEANQMAGSLAFAETTLTVASGAVTATRSIHAIDTEGAAATDDLDTINTGSVSDGCLLLLRAANAGRITTLKNGTGNLVLGADIALSSTVTTFLRRNGSNWNRVGVPYATQTDQETGTSASTVVSPSVQQYHASAAKAWVRFTVSGTTLTQVAGYNCTATRNSAGNYTFTFGTAFSGAGVYTAVGGCWNASGSGVVTTREVSIAAGSYRVVLQDTAGNPVEATVGGFAFYGDQ